jgi:uncharacterized protein (DUF2132 family)
MTDHELRGLQVPHDIRFTTIYIILDDLHKRQQENMEQLKEIQRLHGARWEQIETTLMNMRKELHKTVLNSQSKRAEERQQENMEQLKEIQRLHGARLEQIETTLMNMRKEFHKTVLNSQSKRAEAFQQENKEQLKEIQRLHGARLEQIETTLNMEKFHDRLLNHHRQENAREIQQLYNARLEAMETRLNKVEQEMSRVGPQIQAGAGAIGAVLAAADTRIEAALEQIGAELEDVKRISTLCEAAVQTMETRLDEVQHEMSANLPRMSSQIRTGPGATGAVIASSVHSRIKAEVHNRIGADRSRMRLGQLEAKLEDVKRILWQLQCMRCIGTAEGPDRKDDSRYASKSRALALLDKVAKSAYENNFSALGAITENTTHLRMEAGCMSGLRDELQAIEELYEKDFKKDDRPEQKAGQIGLGSAGSSLEAPNVVVFAADTIGSQEEYDCRLAKYTAECKTAEDEAIEAFLEARIEVVTGSDDVSILTRRVGNIGWITEPGMKLFVHDDPLCVRPHDWKKMRSQKKRIKWGGNKLNLIKGKEPLPLLVGSGVATRESSAAKEEEAFDKKLVKALHQNEKDAVRTGAARGTVETH